MVVQQRYEMSNYTLVDNEPGVAALVDMLIGLPTSPPSLYLDLEGGSQGLDRHGSVSIVQIYVLPQDHTYLLDVHVLGNKAFKTAGLINKEETIKTVLESPAVPKAFFDVRNDNDALYNLHGVDMKCVHDIQLMELARRFGDRTFLSGLQKAIERDLQLDWVEFSNWSAVKEKGRALFCPELGGSYALFTRRPLPDALREYCVQDVKYLPKLWQSYNAQLDQPWRQKVEQATEDRLKLAKKENYNGRGRDKAYGPWPSPSPMALWTAYRSTILNT